jgi:ElaB/YqjD/DUF883 family membrane-anchored ribosome-binding protein
MMIRTMKSRSAEVSGAAEEALQATTHALETTKELVSLAIERAGDKVHGVREGIEDASAAAQWRLGQYAKRTGRYVTQRPVTSALIAAAVGAAVAGLALTLLRNQRERY